MEPSRDFEMELFRSVPSGSQTEHIRRVLQGLAGSAAVKLARLRDLGGAGRTTLPTCRGSSSATRARAPILFISYTFHPLCVPDLIMSTIPILMISMMALLFVATALHLDGTSKCMKKGQSTGEGIMPVDLALLAAAVHERPSQRAFRARRADTWRGAARGRAPPSLTRWPQLAPHLRPRPRIDPRTSTVLRWPVPGWRLAVPVTVPRGWRHSHFAPP
jgi:hypothetical protein